eukprot:CAMPEP_0194520324 /NCGR_PEP_ID=MMETSP0253-20130528/54253_1 /TAXON_ID=2966 /ORGANISM="Noctiluca scintillans" /LENGTH=385 /DNA_ID=CAMNT_0039364541 /DNA_START=66 /DNA_END=1223 /DNA_ORIENTATION=-
MNLRFAALSARISNIEQRVGTPRRDVPQMSSSEAHTYSTVPDGDHSDSEWLMRADARSDSPRAPRTMYGYCAAMLVSPDPVVANKAAMHLVILMFVQQVLIIAFGSQVYLSAIVSHSRPNEEQALTACFHRNPTDHHDLFIIDNKLIHGEPVGILAAGLAGVFLVAANVKSEDRELMEASCSFYTGVLWKSCLLFLVWVLQAVYLTGFFVNAVPTLLSLSNDSLDLVFNMLATTFILEVDNLLYENVLEKAERREYELAKLPHLLTEQECGYWSSLLFKFHVVWMAAVFLWFRLVLNEYAGNDYSEHLFQGTGPSYAAVYGIRAFALVYAFRHRGEWSTFRVCEVLVIALSLSIFCILYFYFVGNNLVGPWVSPHSPWDTSHCLK